MKKPVPMLLSVLFLLLFSFAFKPVPIPHEEDCKLYEGIVESIGAGGENDVTFELSGIDKVFYVNRGLEKGLDPENLQRQLLGEKITVKYPKYWTPLDPFSKQRHVSKIEFEGKTLFSEVK